MRYGLYPKDFHGVCTGYTRVTYCTNVAVARLVEALRYKPEGRGFDSRWCHWNFFIDTILLAALWPWVDSASNRNEYQEYFLGDKGGRCVGLTTLPPSCALLTYLLTPWSRVLLEKLTSKLCSYSRNSPHLWNPKVPHRTHK